MTLPSISPRINVFCLPPYAWLESYGRHSSFGTKISGSLSFSPVLWVLSSHNTLSLTHSDTAWRWDNQPEDPGERSKFLAILIVFVFFFGSAYIYNLLFLNSETWENHCDSLKTICWLIYRKGFDSPITPKVDF